MNVYPSNVNMSFRKASILVAAITFLFLTPIFIIIIIRANNKKQIWAPMVSKCPDYWAISKNKQDYVKCTPGKNNSGGVLNPNGFFTYQLPTKQDKYNYAIKNGVVWDGITNNTSLMNAGEIETPQRSFFWLLGKMFTDDGNTSKQYMKTQDPSYMGN